MARFLINKLSDDGLIGETNQMKTILHNLMIIGPKYKEGFMKCIEENNLPYVIQICICGRFVTYIEVSKDLSAGLMRFYDLRYDYDLALDAGSTIRDKWVSLYYFDWFMEEFQKLKEVYSDNHDAAELLLAEDAGLLLN